MSQFVYGIIVTCCVVAVIFFVRFWRETHDRLFVFFALAFAIMGANWTAIGLMDLHDEARTLLYALRLVAFGLIIFAIVDKNRSSR